MSSLALSDSFEYLCYGSTTIRNIFILTVWGSTYRQILMTKVYPRAVRVNGHIFVSCSVQGQDVLLFLPVSEALPAVMTDRRNLTSIKEKWILSQITVGNRTKYFKL